VKLLAELHEVYGVRVEGNGTHGSAQPPPAHPRPPPDHARPVPHRGGRRRRAQQGRHQTAGRGRTQRPARQASPAAAPRRVNAVGRRKPS
jgi:hypothetical protein